MDRKHGMFDMYEGLKVNYQDKRLKRNEESLDEISELVEDSPSTYRKPSYTISRTYDVPNGTYSVNARAKVRSGNITFQGTWQFESQGLPLYGSATVPMSWIDDESDSYDVHVTDGKLKCDFIWAKTAGPARTGFVEYVEFRYYKRK